MCKLTVISKFLAQIRFKTEDGAKAPAAAWVAKDKVIKIEKLFAEIVNFILVQK